MIKTYIPEYVSVCSSCLRSSCVQGLFFCEDYKTADIIKMHVGELRIWEKESEHYWEVPYDN